MIRGSHIVNIYLHEILGKLLLKEDHGLEWDLSFSIGIDARSNELLFEDGICRSCGYHTSKHRVVLPEELTPEWKICAKESSHTGLGGGVIFSRYICIHRKDSGEYMTREEFEELYDDDEQSQ